MRTAHRSRSHPTPTTTRLSARCARSCALMPARPPPSRHIHTSKNVDVGRPHAEHVLLHKVNGILTAPHCPTPAEAPHRAESSWPAFHTTSTRPRAKGLFQYGGRVHAQPRLPQNDYSSAPFTAARRFMASRRATLLRRFTSTITAAMPNGCVKS